MYDAQLRSAVFGWLDRVTHGGATPVTWSQLTEFRFNGQRTTLIGAKGIWRPAGAELPISITTSPPKGSQPAPYDDAVTTEGLLRYRYEGTDPQKNRNRWLRECMQHQVPLVYFHGIERGSYVAAYPSFIVDDHPSLLAVDVDLVRPASMDGPSSAVPERQAAQRIITERIGQADFRTNVLKAYDRSCSMCRLRHTELLDAAHITAHYEGGPSEVTNGIALCKIHHAAFDSNILGIDPVGVVHLRNDMLDEVDGPMLRHGLQEMHRSKLYVPRSRQLRPNRARLERRWEDFKAASP